MARGHSDVPRIIAAQPGPAKVAATAGAGRSRHAHTGLKVYEQPAPADEQADQAPAPADTKANEKVEPPADILAAPKPDETKSIETKPVEAKPVETAPAKKAAVDKSVATLLAETRVVTPPAPRATIKVAGDTPCQRRPKRPRRRRRPGLAVHMPPSRRDGYVLQIGAYKSEEDANSAWRTYQSKHASLLSGYGPDVKKVDLGSKGIWYRLRAGSFADKEAAKALCDRLTAEGGACFPAK